MCVSIKTLKNVDTIQNNLIRRNVHVSILIKSLKLENFKDLFYRHKLSFLNQVKGNSLTNEIFKFKVLQSSSFNELYLSKVLRLLLMTLKLCVKYCKLILQVL
jgi:hypothetical protein